jgi:hypothetical protein
MGTRRRAAGALAAAVVALASVVAIAPAGAGSLDVCAQRVIRDWYSGGRVDRIYPLRCYRAAILALPSDVLAYSDADQDIRRALAFARRGRPDPGDGPGAAADTARAAEPDEPEEPATEAAPATTPPVLTPPRPRAKPSPDDVAIAPSTSRLVPDPPTATATVPYPLIALAGLAGVLLATGAAGWLASRRHGQGGTPDS